MIPLRDNIQPQRTPVVNYTLIGVTTVVFLLQFFQDQRAGFQLIHDYGMIPARVVNPDESIQRVAEIVDLRRGLVRVQVPVPPGPIPPWLTILTCIFLHGGFMHFLGNMWFLYIFGDNVEDRLGRVGYVLFYLGTGVAASLTQVLVSSSSTIPTVGASGAISGVMGAYLLLYPRATVLTIFPFFVFLQVLTVPAWIFLGIWFLFQFYQGSLSFGYLGESGGVAWWAHIGGFVAGMGVIFLLRARGKLRKQVDRPRRRSNRRSSRYVRYGRRRY